MPPSSAGRNSTGKAAGGTGAAGGGKSAGTGKSAGPGQYAGTGKSAGTARSGGKGAGAAKPAAKRATGAGRAGGTPTGPDLQRALRDFAAARPNGWNHDDWTNFLQELESRGHNINDRDQIGAMLERERVMVLLEKVQGIGPQRVRSVADKYGSVWRLREASADDIAREAGVPRSLAEKLHQAVH